MGRFWDFVQSANALPGQLPLVHATDMFCFRDIRRDGQLRPTECAVYNQPLLYFFYGRPSYRPHATKQTITAKALLPVCFVMSRALMKNAIRMLPFDSGAFSSKRMHPPMHEKMAAADFELVVDINAPMRVVDMFYGNERSYFDAKARPSIQTYDQFNDLEIDSYFRLLSYRSNADTDDRLSAIEIQLDKPVDLIGHVHAVVLPKPYLDKDGILQQIESWGAFGIPYNVKEEFIPREVQGSIFDRLTDFFEQENLLARR